LARFIVNTTAQAGKSAGTSGAQKIFKQRGEIESGRVRLSSSYAPDLNPVAQVWGHTKYGDLANFTPDTLPALEHAALTSLAHTRGQRPRLATFFRAAGLAH